MIRKGLTLATPTLLPSWLVVWIRLPLEEFAVTEFVVILPESLHVLFKLAGVTGRVEHRRPANVATLAVMVLALDYGAIPTLLTLHMLVCVRACEATVV